MAKIISHKGSEFHWHSGIQVTTGDLGGWKAENLPGQVRLTT